MVQLINSSAECPKVKFEFDELQEDQLGPLQKRSRYDFSPQQWNPGDDSFSQPSSTYCPLDEPSPLGLRLKKSPSLLDLIQMKLSQPTNSKVENSGKKDHQGSKASSSSDNKRKASNFPASILKIGTWEYKSRYEGDLIAKCYFAKHKLVWEVLDGCLKNKIEIQWSDIMAIKADYPDDGPGTLDVVLARRPSFFRETNPQPRKHTLWQLTSDFTLGQASIHRRHFLRCPQGLLGKHFEKLIQCDQRLDYLSRQPEIVLDCPYFEARVPIFGDLNEPSSNDDHPCLFEMQAATPLSCSQSTSSKEEPEYSHKAIETDLQQVTSPSSVMHSHTLETVREDQRNQLRLWDKLDQIKVPGIHPSMSMSDLASHIGNYISEQMTSSNPAFSGDNQIIKAFLEDLTRSLFNDSHLTTASDEQILMSRVNSLCCLLQMDPSTSQNAHVKPTKADYHIMKRDSNVDDPCDGKQATGMSRKDSIGELLLHLPRIASLPQFLFNLSEGSNRH